MIDFLLLLSDAARNTTLAGNVLKTMYPKMFHVTCVAHLLHNCAMVLKSKYCTADNLIATMKNAIVKNKDRRQKFAQIRLPPQPIVTRWGTWLKAAFWYAQNLPAVRQIVSSFDDDGIIVSRVKEAVQSADLHNELVELENYKPLLSLLDRCEASIFSICHASEALSQLQFGLDPVNIGQFISKRLQKNDLADIMPSRRQEV